MMPILFVFALLCAVFFLVASAIDDILDTYFPQETDDAAR